MSKNLNSKPVDGFTLYIVIGLIWFFLTTCCKKLEISDVSVQVSGLSTSVP